MKGIILAAGRGSRLNRLTADKPKPLVELAGKPLFDWQLSAMRQAAISDITVITGYLGEQFQRFPVNRIHNPFWEKSNMVRTLLQADNLLQHEDCLVSYGDIVYHPDWVRKLKDSPADIAISYDTDWLDLWSQRFDEPLSDAESFQSEAGFLTDIGRKVSDLSDIAGQYMGLLLFRPHGWLQVKKLLQGYNHAEIDKLDMTSLLSRLLARGISIATVPVAGRWLEVDDPDDLIFYEKQLAVNTYWKHDWRL
ncbi:phosphocholine cytidylyltransferase family protein [Methylophaga sp.]|uniref:phosphocholine cytidylyltransferase family protein n=1 Tax=Methylophaga sp. TaxID=2024840 RepID=UPI0013FEF700|nr:phosphocholine cytidylyltransferase family protein [Methylophaga sp.]MTI63754.1 phosphocholine cytidylyltransferase family protein [Methylophaga sp.]